jgi:hypothetical protein
VVAGLVGVEVVGWWGVEELAGALGREPLGAGRRALETDDGEVLGQECVRLGVSAAVHEVEAQAEHEEGRAAGDGRGDDRRATAGALGEVAVGVP